MAVVAVTPRALLIKPRGTSPWWRWPLGLQFYYAVYKHNLAAAAAKGRQCVRGRSSHSVIDDDRTLSGQRRPGQGRALSKTYLIHYNVKAERVGVWDKQQMLKGHLHAKSPLRTHKSHTVRESASKNTQWHFMVFIRRLYLCYVFWNKRWKTAISEVLKAQIVARTISEICRIDCPYEKKMDKVSLNRNWLCEVVVELIVKAGKWCIGNDIR